MSSISDRVFATNNKCLTFKLGKKKQDEVLSQMSTT